jgi:hypothetical protein
MPEPPRVLATYGYSGSTPDDLAAYVEALDATIADVRYSPRSRVPHWDGYALVGRFADRYVHVQELGNVNCKAPEKGIRLAQPAEGLLTVEKLLSRHSLILLCACPTVQTCHRRVAAELVAEHLGLSPVHLPAHFRDWQAAATQGRLL